MSLVLENEQMFLRRRRSVCMEYLVAAPRISCKTLQYILADRGDFKTVVKNYSIFPESHHAVPESAYFKVPEMLKIFCMYSISRFVYVLHWLATRLLSLTQQTHICVG